MSSSWTDIANVAVAGGSAIATTAAWLAARNSAATAQAVARIERDRRHEELTPRFELELVDPIQGLGTLTVRLAGPDVLGELDEVSIRVGDDDEDHSTPLPGSGVTADELAAHVWGPFRFRPGVDGADATGRSVPPVSLAVGRSRILAMERTRPGHWMTGTTRDQWQERYLGESVRLFLTCRRGEHEWMLPRTVANPPL